jgi:hypothetical protein
MIIPVPLAELPPAGNFDQGVDFIKEQGDTVTLSGWAVQKMNAVDSSTIEIVLHSNRVSYIAATLTRSRPDVTAVLKSKYNLDNAGFYVRLSTKAMPAGRYEIGIYVHRDGDKGMVKWLGRSIDVLK